MPDLDTAALLEYTIAETKQENQETAEKRAQSPVERVTEKVKDPKKVVAGPVDSAPKQPVDKPPLPDRQLKTGPDPFYME